MDSQVTINEEQKLFVIPCSGGFTCLGFDNCNRETEAIAEELKRPDLKPTEYGTLKAYEENRRAVEVARQTGKRLNCNLTPELIGLEGKRVEIIDCYGEKRRFYVGKSTGFLPIHLEISRRDSTGGPRVYGTPFKSVRVINGKSRR